VNRTIPAIYKWKTAGKWLSASLALMLFLTTMSGMAHAADDVVTGIEFDYLDSDYNNSTSSLTLFVEDDKVNLTVLASIAGSSSTKDVTAQATWKTSNANYVKVDKGVLTGTGKGTATITATYNKFSISIKATSDYIYDKVTLLQNGTDTPASLDVEIGQPLRFTLSGSNNSGSEDITDDAVWTSSSTNVATVEDGEVTLKGVGTATITAKFKGKSDTVKLNVTSPYKSIKLSEEKLLEIEIGADDRELKLEASPKTGGTIDVTDSAAWTSGNSSVATVKDGVVSAVGAGKTTITATIKGLSVSLDVIVRAPYQSIRLSPEKEYHLQLQDKPVQITAEVLSNSNVTSNVTTAAQWTSSNEYAATVSNGLVTPKAVGTTKITATHKGVSSSITFTVYPSVNQIAVDVDKIDGMTGGSGDLPAVQSTSFDGSKVNISKLAKWTSADESVAVIKDGKWVAKDVGETTLTAKVNDLEVKVKLIVHVKPVKLQIESGKVISLVIGKEQKLPSVTVINETGEEEDVTDSVQWKASSDNLLLLKDKMKGLDPASVTLTATYLNKTATVKVQVEEEIVKLVVEPSEIELNPGRSKTIKVTGYYKSGDKVSLGSKMNWTVSPATLASVNGASVKAITTGSGKITGSYQGKTVEISIVVKPKLKSLSLSEKSIQLKPGATHTLKLTATYTTGSPVVVTSSAVWTSSKTSVATVVNGKITAVGKGSATIKASFEGKTVSFRVTVK